MQNVRFDVLYNTFYNLKNEKMKRIFAILMLCMIALFSCQDNDLLPEDKITPEQTTDFELSKTETEALLNNFIKVVKPAVNTRSGNQFKIINSRKKYSESIATRSGESTKVAFYEFNMNIENEENYAMVCADKRLPIVVAFIKGNMPLNGEQSSAPKEAVEQMNATLRSYESDFLTILAEREKLPDPFANDYWPTSFPAFNSVRDMIYKGEKDEIYFLKESITWDQSKPYNTALDYTSDGVIDSLTGQRKRNFLGCANVALLNIMARESRPRTFYWRAYQSSPVVSDWFTPSEIKNAANLCKSVYEATNSKSDSSGRTTTSIEGLYAGIGAMDMAAAPVYKGFNIEVIKSSLSYARPIIVAAYDKTGNAKIGHMFVVRGWWKSTYAYPSENNREITAETIAINWGNLGGFGDGWYCSYFDGGGFDRGISLRPIVLTGLGPNMSPRDWTKDMQLISHVTFKSAYIPALPAPMN